MSKLRILNFLKDVRYYSPDDGKKRSLIISKQFSGSMTQKKERILSLQVFKLVKNIAHLLSHASSRAYGASLLSFGLVTLALFMLKLSADASVVTAVLGGIFAAVSLPFLIYDKPLALFLQDFVVTDYVFFEFFCIKRLNKTEEKQSVPLVLSALLGVAVALVGMLLPPWQVLLAIGALAFIYVTFISPEFAFFVSVLALPYVHLLPYASAVFAFVIAISVISFMRKAYFGKRVFYLDTYDVVLLLMMLLVLISGIFIKGVSSFTWSLEMLFMAMGYVLANNVVTNRRLADRTMTSIIVSSIPPAVASIVMFIIAAANGNLSAYIDKGIYFAFAGGSVAAQFFMVAIVFGMMMIKHSRRINRGLFICVSVINLFALILTGEFFALLALLLGIGTYAVLKTKPKLVFVTAPTVFFPLLVLLLPENVINTLFSFVPSLGTVGELLTLWGESFRAFANNSLLGIGMGAQSFTEEMVNAGVVGSNSSSLFLELGLEAGIFALICFIALFIIRLWHRVKYVPYVKNSEVSTISPVCAVGIFCLVTYGTLNYIWADIFSYYLFWCVFGIGSASLRIAKKDTDDKIHYYEDSRASNSSAIDIEVRGF